MNEATTKPRALTESEVQRLVGEFRRFGEAGPAYEIVRIESKDRAWIRVVYSDEELSYPVAEVLADPIAETVP